MAENCRSEYSPVAELLWTVQMTSWKYCSMPRVTGGSSLARIGANTPGPLPLLPQHPSNISPQIQ
eukprot:11271926-Heterocapsa_arctica.AAC.1